MVNCESRPRKIAKQLCSFFSFAPGCRRKNSVPTLLDAFGIHLCKLHFSIHTKTVPWLRPPCRFAKSQVRQLINSSPAYTFGACHQMPGSRIIFQYTDTYHLPYNLVDVLNDMQITTPGTTLPTTPPPRGNQDCGAGASYVGDGYCDPGNNNAGCNWDKRDEPGAVSDCCGGIMSECANEPNCECLDPDYTPPTTIVTTAESTAVTTDTTTEQQDDTTTTTEQQDDTTTEQQDDTTTEQQVTETTPPPIIERQSVVAASASGPNISWAASLCIVALGFAACHL